ncbi:hypothetical protein Pdw03_7365 [Penicillium digitatum]|uniref:Uncharacterized protein n=3 Tax=Penicillium digitatum TaxID=36651 RepID=K9FN14_PEND2|nr:hypothetical protein PDIP_49750 [Penicillium digitatum Pd1]EKV10965.1 hypothetical protein PDIG_54530 [Penicillium digitatum PHI26]EKV13287.1 hypothetical protein PDIP_49750 [Penicillium digitatum Pd1]KAG0155736.1 hypothetical protein PDIDSM_2909 [Penicillium digitatum]QQK43464.1 hypothetical protein Pdw03_7365 [Penicillium digitatum]
MAHKLALLWILMQSIQILALPTYEISVASNSLPSTNVYNKRYDFLKTLPDEDELAAMLKETAMREAGFVFSSNPPRSTPGDRSKDHKMETKTELQNLLPDPETAIGTDASTQPQPDRDISQDTKLNQSQSQLQSHRTESVMGALASDDHRIYWPPVGFFVVSAAIVCCFTVLRGIRAT